MGRARKTIRTEKGLSKTQKNKIINRRAVVRIVPLPIQYRNLIKKYENGLNYIESVSKKLTSNDAAPDEGGVNLNRSLGAISDNENWNSSDDEPINKILEDKKFKTFAKKKRNIEQGKSNMKNDAVDTNRNKIITRRQLFSPEDLPSTSHSINKATYNNTQTLSKQRRSCGQVCLPRKLLKRKQEESLNRNLISSSISKRPPVINLCTDDNNEMMELSSNMSQTSKKSVQKLTAVNAVKTLNQTKCSFDDNPHCSVGSGAFTRSLTNLCLEKDKNRKLMELASVRSSLPECRLQKSAAKNYMNKSETCNQVQFVDGSLRNSIAKVGKAPSTVAADSSPNENEHIMDSESNFSQQPTVSGRNGNSKRRRADLYEIEPFETVDL
ncbi:uncharacterized protein ACN2A1_001616 [Glossina fuscipes fuscipes]